MRHLYFFHKPQFSLLLQAASETASASETACWIVQSMITVSGNIMIMCLIKLIWTDWNLYQKIIEFCLVSCNRKASLLQADILKFANSLKLPCNLFFVQTICKYFYSFCLLQTICCFFWYPPVNIKWFVPISFGLLRKFPRHVKIGTFFPK